MLKDLPATPLFPKWLPDGFTFKYAESFTRLDNTNVLLYYQDAAGKFLVFDLNIYEDGNAAAENINFEKDEKPVEIYEKTG